MSAPRWLLLAASDIRPAASPFRTVLAPRLRPAPRAAPPDHRACRPAPVDSDPAHLVRSPCRPPRQAPAACRLRPSASVRLSALRHRITAPAGRLPWTRTRLTSSAAPAGLHARLRQLADSAPAPARPLRRAATPSAGSPTPPGRLPAPPPRTGSAGSVGPPPPATESPPVRPHAGSTPHARGASGRRSPNPAGLHARLRQLADPAPTRTAGSAACRLRPDSDGRLRRLPASPTTRPSWLAAGSPLAAAGSHIRLSRAG
nr:atherin-like [Aegilops tauschii subsp. strangulata]XP_040258494.1 atherin-like [Aegilops tauschii subsp. strangulata]XP_040258495.1 atherin-like [Aegilops tauschii subsp. strangulata]